MTHLLNELYNTPSSESYRDTFITFILVMLVGTVGIF